VARRFRIAFYLILWLGYCGCAQAQGPQVQQEPVRQASGTHPVANIKVGQSAIPLYGPWKFTVGDSPIDAATHQPLWAEPSFDNSHWETVDLTPEAGAIDPIGGWSSYVPGWTARGHAGYWGYA